MAGSDDQVEEWQRIRDRQIAARDPDAARNKRYQRIQQRHSGARRAMTLKEVIRVLSWKVIGGIVGLVLGVVVGMVLTRLVAAPWVNLAAFGIGVLLVGLGVLIGASFDWRDDLRNF
jgi:sulfite exporter TauE/SafE